MRPEKYEHEYTMILEETNGTEYNFIDYALRQINKIQKREKKLLSKPEEFPAMFTAEDTLLDWIGCLNYEKEKFTFYKQQVWNFILSDAFDLLEKYTQNPELDRSGIIEQFEKGLNNRREYLIHREEEMRKGNDTMDKLFLQAQLSLLTQIRSKFTALDGWTPEGALKFRDYLNSEYHGMIESIASMIEDKAND